MRHIMSMIMEFALEEHKADNAKVELLREAYTYMDQHISRAPGPAPAKLQEALVLGDFPYYFDRVLSRMVYDRYEYHKGGWRDYTFADTLPDYSIGERFRFSEFDRLVKRREKEEPYAGYISESKVQIKVEDYAKQVDFSRQILVNDDLGAFNDLGRKMGDSASRFEDFYMSSQYDNALTQAALVALGANYSGTGRLTTANLAIAYAAFMSRVDARNQPLNIVPKYLVIHPVLRLTARQILESELIAELATNARNVLQGTLEVREDPYITFTTPNIPWYLFADPAAVPAVSAVRMQGLPGPRLYVKAPDKVPMTAAGGLGQADWRAGSFLTGDIELEVETTIGARVDSAATWVGVTDYQGLYYSAGTTP